MRYLLRLGGSLSAFLPCFVAAQSDADLRAKLDAYIAPLEAAKELSGALLIGRGGTISYERFFGFANFEKQEAVGPHTLFPVASITKPLTGIIADRLAAEGRIAPNEPVAKWIPDFPRAAEITIMHLRAHRSGIPHRVTTLPDEMQPQTAESMMRLAARQPLRFDPGTQYHYSSAGFSVLARILELAANKTYAQLLREYVFTPLGASHSITAGESLPKDMRLASGYLIGLGNPRPTPDRNLTFLVGAGSAMSTPRDLFRVVRGLRDAVIPSQYSQTMQQGLYWNGITNGFRTFVLYVPAQDATIIWTGNTFTGASDLLRRDIPRILSGEAVPPPKLAKPSPIALGAELRSRLEGDYEFGPGQLQRLQFLEPNFAMFGPEYALIPIREDAFYSPQDYATLIVEYNEQRAVTGLRWEGIDAAGRTSTLRFARR